MNAYSGPVEVLPVEHDLYEARKDFTPLPDPYLGYEDDLQDTASEVLGFAAASVPIINHTPAAMAFLRHQHEIDSSAWDRLCLALQRTARNCPAGVPSAFVAANMTPRKFRVGERPKWQRGMVGYSWNESNPGAGHIFGILGRNVSGECLCWTNDAFEPGKVDIVKVSFFEEHWGHTLQFAATWLNGFEFPDFHKEPVAPKPKPAHLGSHYKESMVELKAAIDNQEKKGHHNLALRLKRQYDHLAKLLKDVNG